MVSSSSNLITLLSLRDIQRLNTSSYMSSLSHERLLQEETHRPPTEEKQQRRRSFSTFISELISTKNNQLNVCRVNELRALLFQPGHWFPVCVRTSLKSSLISFHALNSSSLTFESHVITTVTTCGQGLKCLFKITLSLILHLALLLASLPQY